MNNIDKFYKEPLYDYLVCPFCKKPLFYNAQRERLECRECAQFYPEKHDVIQFLIRESSNEASEKVETGSGKRQEYVFIFTESLKKTDVQYGELISLLRMNVLNKYGREPDIQIMNDKEGESDDHLVDLFTITIRKYNQSCVVESSLDLDLKFIIDSAGYVHSDGDLIYSEVWDHTKRDEVVKKMKEYASSQGKNRYRFCFLTKTSSKDETLRELVIDEHRFFLGETLFKQNKDYVEENLKDCLNIENKNSEKAEIIIYKDNQLSVEEGENDFVWEEGQMYFLIYHCSHKKENPLHKLDEDKPYRINGYTTPAPLMKAMLNLAMVKERDTVIDPFAYTGTLALETCGIGCQVIASDICETLGLADNIHFLTKINGLNLVDLKNILISNNPPYSDLKQLARDFLKYPTEGHPFTKPKEEIEELLEKKPLLNDRINRLCFYIIRRFYVEKSMSGPEEDSFMADLTDYVKDIIRKLEKYRKTVRNQSQVDKIAMIKSKGWDWLVLSADATKLPISESSIDVIVTDPPYGYGTEMTEETLYEIYRGFFEQAFRVLKDEGRLVISILDKVRTGKPIGPKTRRPGVIKLISKIAKANKIHFIVPEIPSSTGYKGYFYWKSEYALNRVIISLQIKKTPEPPSYTPTYEEPLNGIKKTELKNALTDIQKLRERDLDLSIKKALRLIQENPDDPIILRELAHSYQLKGIYGKAMYLLCRALEMNRNDAETWFRLGLVHTRSGNFTEAEKAIRNASELRRKDMVIANELAFVLWSSGKIDEAIEVTTEAYNQIKKTTAKKIKYQILNNLSYYLAERGEADDIKKALEISEVLGIKEETKLSHLETRGFVLLRAYRHSNEQKFLDEAISLLEYVHRKDLRNAFAAFHLMEAYKLRKQPKAL